jgi:hypothetical protein
VPALQIFFVNKITRYIMRPLLEPQEVGAGVGATVDTEATPAVPINRFSNKLPTYRACQVIRLREEGKDLFDTRSLWDFVEAAPYLMLGAFVVTFVLTKAAQSEAVQRRLIEQIEGSKLDKVRRLRAEYLETRQTIILDDMNVSEEERNLLEKVRERFFDDAHRIYDK